jgi:serine/threonine protein kinase
MNTQGERCGAVRLDLLLSDDETSDQFRAAAGHVETCAACQQRLTTLAAEASWWNDAHTLLSGECEPRWVPDASHTGVFSSSPAEAAESLHDTVLKLLGAPGHPEMLGRLGRYDIERVIGSGGMGVVLKAHDSELNRPIAVKLLAPHLAHVGAARERFAREGRAAAAVMHEHVVAIYNVESSGPVPFLVMQYVPGRSLQARVDEDGPLGVEEILRIGMQAAAGLAAAHGQGLVHRDVKPSNILLENQVERAVLTDFGLARAIDDASLTQTGILAGTPHYMSPEQATGGPIDHRSDLFSLGAVLYFMATGHPPFRATGSLAVLHRICHERHRPVWQFNKDIPDELCDAIDDLLEKRPGRRPATAEEIQQRLSQLLSRVQQRGLGRRRLRGWHGRRLRRKVLWSAFAASLAAAIFIIAPWLRQVPGTQSQVAAQPSPGPVVSVAKQPRDESAALQGQSAPLYSETIEIRSDFGQIANAVSAASHAAYFLQDNVDPWYRELDAVRNEVVRIEATHNTSPGPGEGPGEVFESAPNINPTLTEGE